MHFSDYNSNRIQQNCIDKDTFLFFKHLQRAAVWCEAVMQNGDHPLEAGAGPVIGAIQAAAFGWLPVLLWILLGGNYNLN